MSDILFRNGRPAVYAAIDLGATSGRVMLGDGSGNLREIHRFPTPMLHTEKGIFWDFEQLSAGVIEGLSKLDAAADNIVSVSCDSWAQDFGFLDESGKLVHDPFSYRDKNSEIHTKARLEYIEQKFPELRKKAHCMLHISDLIHHCLCGAARSNYTLTAFSKLPCDYELFGRMADSEVIGTINHPALPKLAGVPVVSGAGHDTAAAYVGGNVQNDELLISLGTWFMMAEPWDKNDPVPENFGLLPLPGHKSARTAGGMGMWPFQQCVKLWKERGDFPGYPALDAAAANSAVTGSINPDEPSLFSPENMEDAIFELIGRPLTPGDVTALLLRGVAKRLGEAVKSFDKEFKRVVLVGGASSSPLIRELIARELSAPLAFGNSEASAFGNICIQQQVMRDFHA